MVERPRRLRQSVGVRRLVAETRLHPSNLVLPMFVVEGLAEPRPIASMPGVVQHSLASLAEAARQAQQAGIGGLMLFGIPTHKDAVGSEAVNPDGILAAGVRTLAAAVPGMPIIADLCLDEFTDHGHCGVLDEHGQVANDPTLTRYREMATVLADAGATMVGTSGMMDGQVAAVRDALDKVGRTDTLVLAYAAKYASAFYGPFREAVASSRPALLPARPGKRRRSPARGTPRRGRGCRHRHGQACPRLPGRARRGDGDGRRADRGLRGLGGVRDGRGSSGQRLDRS